MSQCRKFVPNIFHQSKCSNCFRQLNEHTTEALECNRVTRSIARSGYLFVAPDWDFSVPLNRTKRWQRRWFVLYDDGQLNYSVDEHPDTIPQGSVDMTTVLEVTGAEQVTGHAHSLALTGPDRVTFVKAASREEARWWAELLAVFPRRPKRNATFPGGRVPPSLPQLGRSASPQPPRPLRHLSLPGPSPRTNFETPPLKEDIPPRHNERKKDSSIDHTPTLTRKDYVISSGSPPTRDKLRGEEKMRVRRDWRHERFRNIATALTESPDKTESRLALPSEGLLHLKKGWLRLKSDENDWLRRWTVLCGPTLNVYRDQDENRPPALSIELSTVTGYAETSNAGAKHGFRIEWAGPALYFNALTRGIRSNWMQALKMALESMPQCSSDDEYRTASEGGRRESGDWTERLPRLPRCQSRHSTLNSTSTDELEALKAGNAGKWGGDVDRLSVDELKAYCAELQRNLDRAVKQVRSLKTELTKCEAAYDRLELTNHSLRAGLDAAAHSHRAEVDLLAARLDHLTAKLRDKTRKRGRRKTDEAEVVRRSVAGVVDQLQRVLLAKLRTLDEEKRAGRLHPLHCLAEKMAFERVTLARIQQALDGPNSVAEKEAVETGHLIRSLIDKLENHAPKTPTQSKTSAEHLTKILTQHFLSLKQDRSLLRAATVKQESPKLQWLLEQQRHLHSLYRDYFDKQIAFFSEESLNRARHLSTEIAHRQLLETEVNRALSRAARTYRANYDSDVTFAFYASERAALELWSDSVASSLDREMAQARAALPERAASDPEAVRQFADVVAHKALIDARIDVLTGRFRAELRLVAVRDEPPLVGADAEAEFLCMFDQSPGNWDGNPQLSSKQN